MKEVRFDFQCLMLHQYYLITNADNSQVISVPGAMILIWSMGVSSTIDQIRVFLVIKNTHVSICTLHYQTLDTISTLL